MIELVDEQGYGAVRVRTLVHRAGVSSRAFYKCFKGKQACLLDTYDAVMHRAARKMTAATVAELDGREQLRLGLNAFALELARDPRAARLALIEVSGAGMASLERLDRVSAMFEGMLGACLARASGAKAAPPLLAKAVGAGIARMARGRVLAGRVGELPDLVDELVDWALCIQVADIEQLENQRDASQSVAPASTLKLAVGADDDRERELLLSAAAGLAGREGYWNLSGTRISEAAGVSTQSFSAHFEDVEACFLGALTLLNDRVLDVAKAEGSRAPDWPSGVHRALTALAVHSARDPALPRLAFVEVFAPGPEGLRQREQLTGVVAGQFRASAPTSQRPSKLAADASAGAIWGVVYHYVATGHERQLPQAVPLLSLLALAPAIGAESAVQVIRAERSRDPAETRGAHKNLGLA